MGLEEITPKENQSENMNGNINEQDETPPPEEMDTNSENEVNEDDVDEENDDNVGDMTPEEFAALDNQLDALNSALDDIEQKNDNIHSQLLELLHANREIRSQLQQDKTNTESRADINKTNEPKS